MKPKTIFLIIFILAFASLLVFGYFKAIPGIEDQTEKRPEISITPEFFDFGEIEYGELAEYIFKIKNSGEEILEIRKVATSCACTTAKTTKEKIEPGEEVELLVTYDTGAMSGPHGKGEQERIIYVKSNDPVNPQAEVIIYANVK